MAPLYWDRLRWPEFVAKLEGYRENYSKQGREDPAYLRCLRIMRERPMVQRAARTRDIVLFLNTWSCHLPREISVQLLSRWIPRSPGAARGAGGRADHRRRLPRAFAGDARAL